MRKWTITDRLTENSPKVWIVPQETFVSFSHALWEEAREIPKVSEGSFSTIVSQKYLVIVVNALPVRQLRRQIFYEAARAANKLGFPETGLWLTGLPNAILPSVISGVEHGLYRYQENVATSYVQTVTVVGDAHMQQGLLDLTVIAQAQSWTRDWVNMPPNEKPPELLSTLYQQGAPSTVHFEAFHEKELVEMQAGGILAVGHGSVHPPVLLVGRYQGNGDGPWIALVGKGITFDSGGISLKQPEGMGRLKGDMAGSAAVMATLRVVAQFGWPINVMALTPLAENLPDGRAYRPGDVLTMLDKTRVEVISTDAEGRLVLADAVTMALRQGASHIVDIATLTGSNVVTLGAIRAALITNHEELGRIVAQAGGRMEEPVWEMPNDPEYARLNKSSIADLKNSGGRPAGTISAGLFIGHFSYNTPWAHLDIAGLAFDGKDTGLGATGYGVATLVELCRLWAESNTGK